MKIGLRILLGYFLVVGLAGWFLLNVFVEEVKPGVRDTLEDTLVDSANLLAGMVVADLKTGTLQQSALAQAIGGKPGVTALISGVHKKSFDFRITVTDEHGIVLYDSTGQDIGSDYSRWNDVYRTMHGQYGARSTRSDPNNPVTSVMHVAAPIVSDGRLLGVLTLAKPISSVQPFVERSQRKILQRGGVLMLVSLLIGLIFAYWLNRELGKLQSYAARVEAGQKAVLPKLGNNEIGALGRALESMRDKLEGKEYAEELMHTLAHELKSPIAAIRASAELLAEDVPAAGRARFLDNILTQNQRQQQLIDKLLALVTVEKQQQLVAGGVISLREMGKQLRADFCAKLDAKRIRLAMNLADGNITGDALLMRQAIGNLLDNAIDFSPPGGTIEISANVESEHATLTVADNGNGIPEFALPRLFERFYSLPRQDGARSTGLGLPFVREVASLHGGTIEIRNAAGTGVIATVTLPLR